MRTLLPLLILSSLLFSADGYKVFNDKCSSCHIEDISKKETLKRLGTLKAPPMIEVANRLKSNIMIAEEDEDMHRAVVIGFIKHYITQPDIMYSMCDPIAIEKFGQMPSMKGKLTDPELDAVAKWIYDHYEEKPFN